jgi:hypothetical protein
LGNLNSVLKQAGLKHEESGEALRKAIQEGGIKSLHGTIEEFEKAFFGYFDPKPVGLPPLSVR